MAVSGYIGSDKTDVDVFVYPQADPNALGTNVIHIQKPEMIQSLNWDKQLGPASGRWSLDLKTNRPDFWLDGINDDDWIDITIKQHDHEFMLCRGLIDTVRERRSVSSGATSRVVTLTGQDFGKIWNVTPVFFNRFLGRNVGGGLTLEAFAANNAIYGPVDATVKTFLFGFLRTLENESIARWAMPSTIPGAQEFFEGSVGYDPAASGFKNDPARVALNPYIFTPSTLDGRTLWDLTKEWSDPMFCELFTDLHNGNSNQLRNKETLTRDNAKMQVVLRNKPFLSATSSTWFDLPMFTVQKQELDVFDVGRSGDERFNAFFVKSPSIPENYSGNIDLTLPIWDPDDIARRGIRRMDVTTNYVADLDLISVDALLSQQRTLVRDWYGLNPFFSSGTISLTHCRPDIRIGSRLRIPGTSESDDWTFYIEGVHQSWSLGGGKTSLTVTRGWHGSDQSLYRAVASLQDIYQVAKLTESMDDSVISTGQ